ncbi:MAG: hypothetical protein RIA69_10055 [Cyclobacteriaceae bacterium]
MKKALIVLLVIVIGGFTVYKINDEPLPEGKTGPEADLVANKMLAALNKEAYDSATMISWSFRGAHQYEWNKPNNEVEVQWDDITVNFNTTTLTGNAKKAGENLKGEALKEAIDQAWQFFANDSFWLVAPYKVFDPGTKRTLVDTPQGYGLLISYSSGGVTPGDSYLWLLDENYFPTGWKMWTQIIPLGGVEFTWTNWEKYGGFWLAKDHEWLISVPIMDIQVQ